MKPSDQRRLPDGEQDYYANYFLKIEALFAALRGRSLLLSPADYQLAKSWFERGIPLSCVLRGIRAAYFKKLADAEDAEDEVRSLSWCRWAVRLEWKEYRAVPVEPEEAELSPPERSGDEVEAILDSLVFDVSRARARADDKENDALATALANIARVLNEQCQAGPDRPGEIEDLEARLRELDEEMMASACSHLDEETRRKIERSVSRKLKPHAGSMDEAVLEKTRRAAIRSKVRMALALPLLTLYTV